MSLRDSGAFVLGDWRNWIYAIDLRSVVLAASGFESLVSYHVPEGKGRACGLQTRC